MIPGETSKLEHTKRLIEAFDADLRHSSFRNVNLSGAQLDDVNLTRVSISNVNMSHLTIRNACLHDMSIADCSTEGATINGIPIDDLLASYDAAKKSTTSPAPAATPQVRTPSKMPSSPGSDRTSG